MYYFNISFFIKKYNNIKYNVIDIIKENKIFFNILFAKI